VPNAPAQVAEAVAQLRERGGSRLHRPLAWIDCGLAYRRLGLWELEEEVYAEAQRALGTGWPDAEELIRALRRRVVELNRLEARAQRVAEQWEAGCWAAAADLAREGAGLPGPDRDPGDGPWGRQAAAVRMLLRAAAGDSTLRADAEAGGSPGYASCRQLATALLAARSGDGARAAADAERAVPGLADDVLPALHLLALALSAGSPPPSAAGARYVGALTSRRLLARRHLLDAARTYQERQRLLHENRRLAAQAYVDPLTGLANRHAYARWLDRLRVGEPASVGVLLVDVDWFKQINDGHGHAVGDEVLRRIAATLTTRVRSEDLVVRLGGDEFILLFDAADEELVADRARQTVEAIFTSRWDDVAEGLRVSLSAGFAVGPAQQVDEVIEHADRKLYRAKDLGRGRLVGAGP